MQQPDNAVAFDHQGSLVRRLRRLSCIRQAIPAYFGPGPNGDMAQDAFEHEFTALLDEEEEIMRELTRKQRAF